MFGLVELLVMSCFHVHSNKLILCIAGPTRINASYTGNDARTENLSNRRLLAKLAECTIQYIVLQEMFGLRRNRSLLNDNNFLW